MADTQQPTHRPGPWKQQNKAHKHGKHKSKGTLMDTNKGRVPLKTHKGKTSKDVKRRDRLNQMKQVRANKRNEILALKRSVGTSGSPPHLVVCVSLSSSIGHLEVLKLLTGACGSSNYSSMPPHTSTHLFTITKQRFTFTFPASDDLYDILDIAKVADTLLFVYNAGEDLSNFSELVLDSCSAHGMPSSCHVVMGLADMPKKKHSESKKTLQDYIDKRYPKKKLRLLDNVVDACNALRFIGDQKRVPLNYRDNHPHIIAESVQYVESASLDQMSDGGHLEVSGYIRGRSLSVNGLISIPDLGEFQMSQIDLVRDPCPVKGHLRNNINDDSMITDATVEMMDECIKVLEVADPSKQESLVSEIVPDSMDGEQTWPTQEEIDEAVKGYKSRIVKSVPKGVSKYQAAWIVDSDGEEHEEMISDDDDDNEGAWQWKELDSSDTDDESEVKSIAQSTMDTASMVASNERNYDEMMDVEEEKKQLSLLRAEKDYILYPDEVDTPLDVSARVRFQKYRGLKSFKSSPWDPKEELPLDYARIFQFENFKQTKKRVLSSLDEEGAMPGWYVTVHITGVPKAVGTSISKLEKPLIINGLLPHENKMSVVNFLIKRTPQYTLPIKSKEELIFCVGSRRFFACPIFSQHTHSDKHKYEKFLPPMDPTVATVYCPVSCYPPSTVLVFKSVQGCHVLVATGVVQSVNPSRIVCKKILLSGHPLKIHKRSAVVRYMFFTRDDVQWFKPVELKTKHGLKGHIKEPLGTHGHMKCVFDKQLKGHDTVLMPLYKRVFPKWTYNSSVPHPLSWCNTSNAEDSDMV